MRREVIGAAILMQDDCLEAMGRLGDASVDLVLTDPPYCSGARKEAAKGMRKHAMTRDTNAAWFPGDDLTVDDYTFLMRKCALEWKRILKPGGRALVFVDQHMDNHAASAIGSAGLRRNRRLVWNKTYFGLGADFRHQHEYILHFSRGVGWAPLRRDVGDLIDCPPVRGGAHPTQKPVALLEKLMSVLCPVGGLVLDPFFGSGSTAVAAVASGRRFVGSEHAAGHFNAALTRVAEAQATTLELVP